MMGARVVHLAVTWVRLSPHQGPSGIWGGTGENGAIKGAALMSGEAGMEAQPLHVYLEAAGCGYPTSPAPSPDHVTQGTVWRLSAQIGIYMFSKLNEWLGGGMRGSPWGSFRLPPDCNSRVKGLFRCRSWGNSDEDLNSPPQTWPAIVGVVESDVNGCRSGGIEPSPATTKREGS